MSFSSKYRQIFKLNKPYGQASQDRSAALTTQPT